MNSFTKICILFLIFSVNFSLVYAKQSLRKNRIHKEALSAAKKGDYGVAYRKWFSLAKNGNSDAQYNIGVMYLRGDGLQRSNKLALHWLMKASKKEHILSQFTLGRMYYEGMGVLKNYKKSLKWYKKAAINGHKKAQNNLGFMYFHGVGVKKDRSKAYKWFLESQKNNFFSTVHLPGQ